MRAEEASLLSLCSLSLAMLAQSTGVSHLHAHFGSNATTAALLASRISGIAYSFTAHARDIFHTYVSADADAAMRRRKIAEAQFVATVSDHNRHHLIELAGRRAAHRIHRVYNGVDLARFRPNPDIPRDQGLLLSIGRLIEKKGFVDLLEACRILRDRGIPFRCLIVGDGPLRNVLQQKINDWGLASVIQLLGWLPQEQVIGLMRRAAVHVLACVVAESGDRDGLPTVLLEALAIGLPCVSTTLAGIPEIIDDNVSGLLVPPRSPRELADAIARLLQDPELQTRFARLGHAKAKRDFAARLAHRILTSRNGRLETLDEQNIH
jgi:glycosyltransferase involved in cell wall biosynthesis